MKKIVSVLTCFSLLFVQGGEYDKMGGFFAAVNALLHKNEIISSQYKGEISTEVFDPSADYSLDDTAVLIKEKGSDFVILNITDPHFSDYDSRALMAFGVENTVRRLVREAKPDLITVTGDIVCGDSTHYSIDRFTSLMDSFGIPWAPVFGNHDAEANCDADYLAEAMMKSKTCLFKKGDPRLGVGNYVVNIAEKEADGSLSVVESLIMMDSHKTHVNSEQIEWFEWAARGVNSLGGAVETTVFFHIPLAEYQYAYDEAWNAQDNCWREGYGAVGELHEKICCDRDENDEPVNNGFFAAAKRSGSTKFIFCGHEHVNDFSLCYQGIRLTYTLKVGKGSGHRAGFNGGTLITVGGSGINSISHRFINFGIGKTLKIL